MFCPSVKKKISQEMGPEQWNVPYSEMFCLFVLWLSILQTSIKRWPINWAKFKTLYIPLTWILITRMFETLFVNYFITYRWTWTNDIIIGWDSFPTWSRCRTSTHCYQLHQQSPTFHFIFRFSLFSVVSKNRKNLEKIFIRKVSLE